MYREIEYFLEENVFIPQPSCTHMRLPSDFLAYQVCSHKALPEYWDYQMMIAQLSLNRFTIEKLLPFLDRNYAL